MFVWLKGRVEMQFMRFAFVGILNTLIDFGVLNGLLWLNGYSVGRWLFLFNSLAFILASGNSYLWNKYWTFGDERPATLSQVGLFFADFDWPGYQLLRCLFIDLFRLVSAGCYDPCLD